MYKILIIDDNPQINNILSEYAKHEGYHVFTALSGEAGLEIFQNEKIDVILLDLMLPGINGFDVCRSIRKESNVPILMITAKNESDNQIYGLDSGADDYIIKPFEPKAVFARIRAVLRRIEKQDSEIAEYKSLRVDVKSQYVSINGAIVNLSSTEIKILYVLTSNIGRVFTRENLLDLVYGYTNESNDRAIDSHIKRLRQKLEKIADNPIKIKTIWGLGYKLEYEEN